MGSKAGREITNTTDTGNTISNLIREDTATSTFSTTITESIELDLGSY